MDRLKALKKEGQTKLGQGHIELILSFIIFVGFVVALLVILNPVNQKNITYSSLNDVQDKILNNLSITYEYIGLILTNPIASDKSCFYIEDKIQEDSNFIVRDESGVVVDAKLSADKIYIKNTGKRYYKFYFSNSFHNSDGNFVDCAPLLDTQYNFGVLNTEKIIFYENFYAFNNSYIVDYATLKKNLKIENDFDFVLYDIIKNELFNESLLKNNKKITTILSTEIALKTLNKNAESRDVILRLRTW
jgi:hypothetical protein